MLAAAFDTVWVPEYARAYLEGIRRIYDEEDLLHIAKEQVKAEDKWTNLAKKFLICDTDLNVIKVWSEHKYNRCARWILEEIAQRKYDLYLLTDIDVAWQEDPLREHPEENMRQYFYQQYKDIVANSGVPWQKISGDMHRRLTTATHALKHL